MDHINAAKSKRHAQRLEHPTQNLLRNADTFTLKVSLSPTLPSKTPLSLRDGSKEYLAQESCPKGRKCAFVYASALLFSGYWSLSKGSGIRPKRCYFSCCRHIPAVSSVSSKGVTPRKVKKQEFYLSPQSVLTLTLSLLETESCQEITLMLYYTLILLISLPFLPLHQILKHPLTQPLILQFFSLYHHLHPNPSLGAKEYLRTPSILWFQTQRCFFARHQRPYQPRNILFPALTSRYPLHPTRKSNFTGVRQWLRKLGFEMVVCALTPFLSKAIQSVTVSP